MAPPMALTRGDRMAHNARTPLLTILVSTVLALTAGCAAAELPPPSSAPPAELIRDAPGAAAALETIKVTPFPGRDPSYERDAFGEPWSDSGVGIELARNG